MKLIYPIATALAAATAQKIDKVKICPASSEQECQEMKTPTGKCYLAPVYASDKQIDCNREDASPITVLYRGDSLYYTHFAELVSQVLDDEEPNKGEFNFVINQEDSTLIIKGRFEEGAIQTASVEDHFYMVEQKINPSNPDETGITFRADESSAPIFYRVPFCDEKGYDFTAGDICVEDLKRNSFHVVAISADCDTTVEDEDLLGLALGQCVIGAKKSVVVFGEHQGGDIPTDKTDPDDGAAVRPADKESNGKLLKLAAIIGGAAAATLLVGGAAYWVLNRRKNDDQLIATRY